MANARFVTSLGVALCIASTARAWVSTQNARRGEGIAVALFANGDLATASVYVDGSPADMGVARVDGATGAVVWRSDFGTAGADSPLGIAIDRDGNVVTVNSSSPGVIKLDGATGQPLWQIPVPGTVYAFAVDTFGDVVVGGSVLSGPLNQEIVTKYSGASGAMLWTALPFGSYVRSLATDAHGDVFVASVVTGPDGSRRTVLRALTGSGGISLWDLALPVSLPVLEDPADIEIGGDGRLFALLQDTVRSGSDEGFRQGDRVDASWWTVVSADAATGSPLWRTEIHAPSRSTFGVSAVSLAAGPNGDVYACGGLGTPQNNSILSFAVVALDPATGEERWRHILGGPLGFFGFAKDVAVAPDGSVIAAGLISSKKTDASHLFVTSLQPRDGHAIWETTLELSTRPPPSGRPGLAVDPSGGISVMGTAYVPLSNFPATAKLAPDGTSFGVVSLAITPRPVACCICTATCNDARNPTAANSD
jgi:outer membrane protein assembly factor BamB